MALAVRRVDFAEMVHAFKGADYWYLWIAIPVVFVNHFLRAVRWRYLLDPIKRVDTKSLFSSLMIGYMANTLVPAHLGEILRAYVLSKKRNISASSAFATIVTERIIDLFTLIALLVLAMFIYPFPTWVKNSGYIIFAGTLGLFTFLLLLRKSALKTQKLLTFALRPLPNSLQQKASNLLRAFISGIVPLRHWSDYPTVVFLSVIIWACYGLVFYFMLHAFNFVTIYYLPWSASLILLVITTIGVVIPSSPGYVGTYHYLCQVSLAMFGVPASPALSFATLVHAINFLPVLLVGLLFAYYEGVGLSKTAVPGIESEASCGEAMRNSAKAEDPPAKPLTEALRRTGA
jgi:uncharacterized protein (TIRG00374 family)